MSNIKQQGPVPVAFGLKARTGRAILVAVGASSQLHILQRTVLPLLPEGDFAPYHAAANLPPADARESVARSIASAHRLAQQGIGDAVTAMVRSGHQVRGCGILVGAAMPSWTTEEILAVHVRMHQAEGELFREALLAAARACGLPIATLRERSAADDAASKLNLSRSSLDATIAALGKEVGAPWAKDHKEAAAAAIVALNAGSGANAN